MDAEGTEFPAPVTAAMIPPTRSCLLFSIALGAAPATGAEAASAYGAAAREVTAFIQTHFWNVRTGFYAHSLKDRSPEFMWGNGVMFSALVGAARHESAAWAPVRDRFFRTLDAYWDPRARVPGYEPSPTRGGGHDKYYDDNAWMVLTFLEAHEQTRDPRYLSRAEQSLAFVLSGWDEERGGGIWWHEEHKGGSKNTCANAPAAVGCLRLAKFKQGADRRALLDRARRIVVWTTRTLQAENGLFADNISVTNGVVHRVQLTYNAALMLRAFLGLWRWEGRPEDLAEAKRIALAADRFVSRRTGGYRDSVKWSHLMVEADLELFRATGEPYLLERARKNADGHYAAWKRRPPDELIDHASIARLLWLLADTETPAGRLFWQTSDRVPRP